MPRELGIKKCRDSQRDTFFWLSFICFCFGLTLERERSGSSLAFASPQAGHTHNYISLREVAFFFFKESPGHDQTTREIRVLSAT